MSNRLTLSRVATARADLEIARHGRDYVMVETGEPCPSCHGDGKHKTAVPSACGVCLGHGKGLRREPLTELGRRLVESGL